MNRHARLHCEDQQTRRSTHVSCVKILGCIIFWRYLDGAIGPPMSTVPSPKGCERCSGSTICVACSLRSHSPLRCRQTNGPRASSCIVPVLMDALHQRGASMGGSRDLKSTQGRPERWLLVKHGTCLRMALLKLAQCPCTRLAKSANQCSFISILGAFMVNRSQECRTQGAFRRAWDHYLPINECFSLHCSQCEFTESSMMLCCSH